MSPQLPDLDQDLTQGSPQPYYATKAVNLVAGGVGALIGGAVGAVGSLIAQGIKGEGVNWQDVGAAASGGAVSDGLAGLTLGTSLVASATGVIVVSSSSNVVGGAVTRELDSNEDTQAASVEAIATDAAWGAAGGLVAARVDAAFAEPIQSAKQQAAASSAAAKQGNFGARQSVQGHQSKAAQLRTTANVAGTVTGAKTTNVIAPAIEAARSEKECQDGAQGCS